MSDQAWRRWRRALLSAPLLLAACGTSRRAPPAGTTVGGDWSCVPYARSRSGIGLHGDAWRWWEAAEGQFRRDRRPRPGSVLVLMRTSRLPQGHLSVVARVVSSREIRVDHANWGSGSGKGRVTQDQPVVDVSAANNWSLVRVWYARVNELGASNYPAYGFIHPVPA